LSFATTSLTERKAAANNNDLTVARILAESAVNRAIGAMRFYSEFGSGSEFDDVKSHNEDAADPNRQTFDFLWKLGTISDGSTIYEWPRTSYDKTDTGAVHWQYIDNGLTGADKKLIGRIAYVVVGSGGKLDPAACVNHTTPVDENGDNVDRKGNAVDEISIENLDQPDALGFLPGGTVTAFSYTPVGTLTTERWADWDAMFTALGIGAGATAQRDKYREWFILNNPKDPEAFWIDRNNDGKDETSELYHRFYLGREETNAAYPGTEPNNPGWSQITIADMTGTSPDAFSSTTTKYYGKGLMWLKNNTALPADHFSSSAARAKQIAANIIDYCDANSTATTDDTSNPTYTGNDRTPYINEILLQFDGEVTETVLGTGNSTYQPVARIKQISIELCDMYGITATNYTPEVTIAGSYDWQPAGASFTFGPTTLTVANVASNGTRAYLTVVDPLASSIAAPAQDFMTGMARSITNLKISTLKIKLTQAGGFCDYSYVEPNGTDEAYDLTTNGTLAERYVGYQVDGDPRQNLFSTDWQAPTNGTGVTGTINARNTGCNPNPGATKDPETGAADPWDVSTAYIRNATMQSPWELGFIHRGSKWETLNIHEYNTTTGLTDTAGIGRYTESGAGVGDGGDANILDQIKMTSGTQLYGKVNVQSAKTDVLKALLGYVRVGVTLNSTNDNPGLRTSGIVLDYASDVSTMAAAINASGNKPFTTRAQIAKVTSLYGLTGVSASGINQNTKAKKDEVIGKIINLTKIGPSDTLTIIALAQSIRDVGAPSTAATGITINKDLNQDGTIQASTNISGTAYNVGFLYDADNDGAEDDTAASSLPSVFEKIQGVDSSDTGGCKLGQYDLGADEILAEQKVLVSVYRDPVTLKWRIVRFEYIDQ